MFRNVIYAFSLLFATGCNSQEPFIKNVEAIHSESAYSIALKLQGEIKTQVTPDGETEPVTASRLGSDAADDPAIWYNKSDPNKSVIFGTNKQSGIHSYDVQGKELQYLNYAKINNVDVRQDVLLGNVTVDILAGSNRTSNSIDIYIINSEGGISETPDHIVPLGVYQPYGFCLHYSDSNVLYSFFNDKYGNVLQHEISMEGDSLIGREVRKIRLATQAEGMVVDDLKGKVYIGEEQTGIYVFDADPQSGDNIALFEASTDDNKFIKFDIEGLALLPPHYLVASSQGNFSFAIFDTKTEAYLTSFVITDVMDIDGCEETDGIDIVAKYLSDDYPAGMFVAQDGFNRYGGKKENQNFKMVDLRKIIKLVQMD